MSPEEMMEARKDAAYALGLSSWDEFAARPAIELVDPLTLQVVKLKGRGFGVADGKLTIHGSELDDEAAGKVAKYAGFPDLTSLLPVLSVAEVPPWFPAKEKGE